MIKRSIGDLHYSPLRASKTVLYYKDNNKTKALLNIRFKILFLNFLPGAQENQLEVLRIKTEPVLKNQPKTCWSTCNYLLCEWETVDSSIDDYEFNPLLRAF